MTRQEHLLTIVMEECAEVAQRVSKAMRFGMDQIQQDADDAPEQNPDLLSNRERVMSEYYHLRAVMGMTGFDAWDTSERARTAERQKVAKVEKYLERSQRCGTLAADGAGTAPPPEDLHAAFLAGFAASDEGCVLEAEDAWSDWTAARGRRAQAQEGSK